MLPLLATSLQRQDPVTLMAPVANTVLPVAARAPTVTLDAVVWVGVVVCGRSVGTPVAPHVVVPNGVLVMAMERLVGCTMVVVSMTWWWLMVWSAMSCVRLVGMGAMVGRRVAGVQYVLAPPRTSRPVASARTLRLQSHMRSLQPPCG